MSNEPTLTKREYIAAMALQGMLSSMSPEELWSHTCPEQAVSIAAVKIADALLKELEG